MRIKYLVLTAAFGLAACLFAGGCVGQRLLNGFTGAPSKPKASASANAPAMSAEASAAPKGAGTAIQQAQLLTPQPQPQPAPGQPMPAPQPVMGPRIDRAAGLGPPGGQIAPGWPPVPIVGPQPSYNEQVSFMHQRLANSEEDRKLLQARIEQLKGQLREKDRALFQATQEVQETAQQVARTREELQRWKQELLGMRTKLQGVERENRDTLQAIIRTLEQFLEREREGQKTAQK